MTHCLQSTQRRPRLVGQVLEGLGRPGGEGWQGVPTPPPSTPTPSPGNGKPSAGATPSARPQREAVGRTPGCICDGSGWAWQPSTPRYPDGAMVQCPACHAARLQARLVAASGLLPSELGLSLGDVVPNGPGTAHMLAMALEFCREPWGVWTLWGSFGNAKTLILQAVVNHFRRAGVLAVYVRFGDLLDYIRAGFNPDRHLDEDGVPDNHLARYRQLMAVQVLAIDEVDKARPTAFAAEFQTAFLDDRWRYGVEPDPAFRRHTLLAMNDDPGGLPGHIWDRLRDGRFGCWLDGEWQPGVTHNADASMRPAMERPRGNPQ